MLYLKKTMVKSVIYLLFSYQTGYIMWHLLNSGKKYSNSCVVRKKNSERNKKPYSLFLCRNFKTTIYHQTVTNNYLLRCVIIGSTGILLRRISNTVLQPRYWGREADSPEVCRLPPPPRKLFFRRTQNGAFCCILDIKVKSAGNRMRNILEGCRTFRNLVVSYRGKNV
jgi:hypothetical protein